MQSTEVLDQSNRLSNSEAARSMREKGFFVFRNVLSHDEVMRLRVAARQHFKMVPGRKTAGGGLKVSNAAAKVPGVAWVFHHPKVIECLKEAFGTDRICFTSHADVQMNVLNGWHKDDGTDASRPEHTGYFNQFTYDRDDCAVYKVGMYLYDHDHDRAGLSVRVGSHRVKSSDVGEPFYTAPRAGDMVVFDVRITHSGVFKTQMQRRILQFSSMLPEVLRRYPEAGFAKARKIYRAMIGRARIALFFSFGLENNYTNEFAKANMRRQLADEPDSSRTLPPAVRKAFEDQGVLLAEDYVNHFADL